MKRKTVSILMTAALATTMLFASGCAETTAVSSENAEEIAATVTSGTSFTDSSDVGHAILVDGVSVAYDDISVTKTGDSSGDNADFYGENAAVFATNGATLTISDAVINSDGTHANGVFSYGEGTTVNISDSEIYTVGNCSGGLMTTGGGTMNATDLTILTKGNSSAAIRSDKGGGTVNVTGGSYTTEGTGSPAIYSTADITVTNAYLESTVSQGVVIEGRNSVTLNNCTLGAANTKKNSKKSSIYEAVMIYQSMSGDASVGTSEFTMNGGSLTNANGDIFFVNNTACIITLNGAEIINNDASGAFLRAEAAGWGSEGSNGGKVNLYATDQEINGDILVDEISILNLYLKEGSSFVGSLKSSGQEGDVYVELDSTSTWTLTGDSYVSGLTCSAGSIELNGYKLYVNGVEYTEGSESTGSAFEIVSSSSSKSSSSSHSSKPGK
jgi:hypothetical protein